MNQLKEGNAPHAKPAPAGAAAAGSEPVGSETHESLKAKIVRLEDALVVRLGLGGGDTAFGPVDATTLALERTALAAERTLQAWIRTALSLISFGFTIGKLGQVVVSLPGMPRHVGTDSLAYLLVTLGTLSLAVAAVQHWFTMRKLRSRGLPRELSLAFGVAILLILLGAFAFSALVMKL